MQCHSLNFPQTSPGRLTKILKSNFSYPFNFFTSVQRRIRLKHCYKLSLSLFISVIFCFKIKALGLSLSAQEFNSDVWHYGNYLIEKHIKPCFSEHSWSQATWRVFAPSLIQTTLNPKDHNQFSAQSITFLSPLLLCAFLPPPTQTQSNTQWNYWLSWLWSALKVVVWRNLSLFCCLIVWAQPQYYFEKK